MVSQPFRLAQGGRIDRSRLLLFRFDGETYQGHPGDTLASALLANGVSLVGRSFKYHRPRGFVAAGPEEPNGLVELRSGARREPNTRATVAELYDGLEARSQNRWPSLRYDLLSLNQVAAPLLAAGFYYKTFMWPASFWEKVYEPLIRRAAGLGRAAGLPDPDTYERVFAHCDVLVVGGGATGLMAALAAGRSGARVILADEDFEPGGRCLAENREIGGRPSAEWVADTLAQLREMPEVRILTRTTVFGAYDGHGYGALERVNDHRPVPPPDEPRQRVWRITAKRTVLAAGSIERPLVFGENDRPGVMLAGAARTFANRFGVAKAEKAVVFSQNDDAVRTVGDLAAAGVAIAAVVDPRPEVPQAVIKAAAAAGARVIPGVVTHAHGRLGVEGVEIETGSGRETIDCDLVAMSGGWSPTVHLSSHLGGRPVWKDEIAAFVPGQAPPGMTAAGAAAGAFVLADCLSMGAAAGLDAAASLGFRRAQIEVPEADPELVGHAPLWRVKSAKGKAFIDFQNDVTADDVTLARREGFRAVEHLKRYTTLGMATDQGKTANVNGLAMMAELNQRSIAETGTTVFRPPYTPVAIGALAGSHKGREFRPTRLTSGHAWATEQGAVFQESGLWMRASYFPRAGEKDWLEPTIREVRAVREGVGLCDVSTLGKIDVQGPDAAAFLDRLYANTMSTLAVGKARYGLMLREDGFVMDDGTVARMAAQHFVVTTTTANAAKVMMHMEHAAQVIWPELDVRLVSIGEQWAQFAVAGPKSREVLAGVVDRQHDISDAAFPFMAAGAVTVMGGKPARLFRISFSGERAYELAVPAGEGDATVRALMAAGAAHGITPYGLEALNVLRIEKGHVAGSELNGQTTARDIGLGRMVSKKKDFIGRVMAERPALTDPGRPSLVGLKPVDRTQRISAGAHLVARDHSAVAAHDDGYITSAAYSPTLGTWLAIGFLARGPERHGEVVRIADPLRGIDALAEVVHPVFYDPTGARHHG